MELSIGEAFVNLEHEINTVVGEENVSVPSSPTNVIATSQPGPLSDVPIRKLGTNVPWVKMLALMSSQAPLALLGLGLIIVESTF